MATADASTITCLLHAWTTGDNFALDELMPMVYRELRRTARRYMSRQRPNHVLQSGDLVNEVYLRLLHMEKVGWENRSHFYAICAKMMRLILIDSARAQLSLKRGGNFQSVSLDGSIATIDDLEEFLTVDLALRDLAVFDPRKSQVLELRIFGGFSVKETAEILSVSEDTVTRDCQFAKLWLLRQLDGKKANAKR